MSPFALLLSLAWAHPTADAHLHATEAVAPCDDPARLRRAAALADARRLVEAEAELTALCRPSDEAARLAHGRLRLLAGDAEATLVHTAGLVSLRAAQLRSSALAALGREEEAATTLSAALQRQPTAPPDDYLDAAAPLGDEAALELLDLGLTTLGPVGSLQRAAATRLAALGRLPEAEALLRADRPADQLLLGDLQQAAGAPDRARRTWSRALGVLEQARPSRATDELKAQLHARLAAP